MSLLRVLLLGVLAYLIWLRVRPYLEKKKLPSPKKSTRPLPADSERLDGRLPHEILGVKLEASREEVHSAYLRLVREHHPDRAAQLGPEQEASASARTKAINWAYERMKGR